MAVVGIAVSLALFMGVLRLEQAGYEARFHELADQRISVVGINVAAALDTVSILADHFSVEPKGATSRQDFHQLVTPIIAGHPFIQALEWIPRVRDDERREYEAQARADEHPSFVFTERDSAGELRPAEERPEYYPVYYVEPVAGNEKALGYDLFSNHVRREALEASGRSGSLAATARVTLVQEQGDQYGVLVFAPVYQDSPVSVAARESALIGYVLGVFRIGDFIAKTAPLVKIETENPLVDILLYDLSAPDSEQVMYPKTGALSLSQAMSKLHQYRSFDVSGRQWLVVAVPGPAYKAAPLYSFGILAVSLVATMLFVFYLNSNMRRAEAAALFARETQRARTRLTEAQRLAKVGYMEFDEARRQWSTSEGCHVLLGLDHETAAPLIDGLLVHAEPEDMARLKAALAGQGPLDMEMRIGKRLLHVVGENADASEYRLLTVQDITQRRQAEAERADLMTRMAETNRLEALGTLAGGIAHEINTPTQYVGDNVAYLKDNIAALLDLAAAVDGHLQGRIGSDAVAAKLTALDYEFLKDDLTLAADQALDGTERIAKIVQAIKEYCYPSSKTFSPIDLNHLVEVVSVVTRNQWKYVAELEFDFDPLLPHILAVEGEINQVLVNLIVNAAQAIGGLGQEALGRIVIHTRAVEKGVELVVTDTGPGILPEVAPRIFEMFFTTKPPGQGTGQGLAITKAIVMRHGGEISLSSTPGAGASFRVFLPTTPPAVLTDEAPPPQ